MCAQFHWNPETYLEEIRAEVPRYDELQRAAVDAIPFAPDRVLELGMAPARPPGSCSRPTRTPG